MQNCILIWNAYTYFYWVPISSNLNTKLGTCIYLILTQCLVSGKEKTIVGKILMFVLLRKKIKYNWNSNYLLFTFFFLSNFPLDYLSPHIFSSNFLRTKHSLWHDHNYVIQQCLLVGWNWENHMDIQD